MSESVNFYHYIGLPKKQASRALWYLLCQSHRFCTDNVSSFDSDHGVGTNGRAKWLSQTEAAHICGVSRSVMSRSLSLNQPKYFLPQHSFSKAAKALDLSIGDLMCKVEDAHFDSIESPRIHFSLALIHILAARLNTCSEQDAIRAVASCIGVEESRVWDVYFYDDANGFDNEAFKSAASAAGLGLSSLFARLKHTHYQKYRRVFLHSKLRPLEEPTASVDQAVLACTRFVSSRRFLADSFLSASDEGRRIKTPDEGMSPTDNDKNLGDTRESHQPHTEFHAANRLFKEIIKAFPSEVFKVGLADCILLIVEIGVLKTIVRITQDTCEDNRCLSLCGLDFLDLPYPIQRGISECWDLSALKTSLHKVRVGRDSWSYDQVQELFDETHGRAFELSFSKVYCDAFPFISSDGYLRVTMVGGRPSPNYPPAPIDKRPESIELLWLLLCESVSKIWSDSSLGKRRTGKTPLKDSNRLDRHNVSWLEALPHSVLYNCKHKNAGDQILREIDNLFISTYEVIESIVPGKLYASEVWFYDFSYMQFTQNLKAKNPLSSSVSSPDLYRVYRDSYGRSPEDNESVQSVIDNYIEFAVKRRNPPRPNGKTALAVNQGRTIVLPSQVRRSKNLYDELGGRRCRTLSQEYRGDDNGTYIQCPIDILDKVLGRKLLGAIGFRFSSDFSEEVKRRLLEELGKLAELHSAQRQKPLPRQDESSSTLPKDKNKSYLSPMAIY